MDRRTEPIERVVLRGRNCAFYTRKLDQRGWATEKRFSGRSRLLSTQKRHYRCGILLRRYPLSHDLCTFVRVNGLHSAPELLKASVSDQELECRLVGDVRH